MMLFQNLKLLATGDKNKSFRLKNDFAKVSLCIVLMFFSLTLCSCRKPQKTEMRRLLPNNAIVYLETNDLAKTLEAMSESSAFQQLAAEKPDFSALENIQIAAAITSFETSEENSALNFKPKFVAIAETHAWSWQTVSFADDQLDNFVRKNYGADAKLEKSEKNGGKFYIWKAADNRQVFAFVTGSLIYFGTDAAAIETSSAVKSGNAESLLKNENLSRVYSKEKLVFGYVSPDGIAQIANLAGVSAAVKTTEEEGGRAFIARVFCRRFYKIRQKKLFGRRSKPNAESKINLQCRADIRIRREFKACIGCFHSNVKHSAEFLPMDFYSATRYNLNDPLVAWRGLLLFTAKNTDALSGKFLIEFSDRLLEPYAISNAEKFLGAIDSEIITAQFDA